jgi:hypothetical protein
MANFRPNWRVPYNRIFLQAPSRQAIVPPTPPIPDTYAAGAIHPIPAHTPDVLRNLSRTIYVAPSITGPTTITLGQAVETDTAQAITVTTQDHPAITVRPYVPFTINPLPNKSRLLARSGITLTLGLATETDTASAITVTTQGHPAIKPVRPYIPYTAEPLPNKSRVLARAGISITIGLVTEIDTAQPVTLTTQEHPSVQAIRQPRTAYTADALPNKTRSYTFAPQATNTINIGQATETDTASALTASLAEQPTIKPLYGKTYERIQVPNRTRMVFRPGFTITLGQAVETDTAQPITIVLTGHPSTFSIKPIVAHQKDQLPNKSRLYARYGVSISIAQAIETETASPLTVTTTDHPAKLTYVKSFTYDQVPNKSRVFIRTEQTITIGQVTEFDSASAISSTGVFAAVKPTMAKTFERPQVPNRSRLIYRLALSVNIGQVTETDTASPITITTTQHPTVGATKGIKAHSTPELPNKSRLYARRGASLAIGQVTETDSAQSIKANQARTIGGVIEIDSAGTITSTTKDYPCILNRGRSPFERDEVPNLSRMFFVLPPTTVLPIPIEPTPITAGVRPIRIRTKVGNQVTSGEVVREHILTKEGDEITDARLHPNRIEDEG